jgi:hypothetical protein
MTDPFHDDMTIRDAREILRSLVTGKGHQCPCCKQFAKVYRRKIPNATARVMIALYRQNEGRDYVFLPAMFDKMGGSILKGTPHQGGYGTLGQFWGLMERQPGERDDGSDRVGWWRLTDLGRAFVLARARVQSHATLYAGRCLGLDGSLVTIQEALGKKFNYRDLMEGI